MKVVLLLIFALIFLGISAKGKVCDFEEYNVVCTIYDGGRNHTHKAPRREKEIQLKVTAQSVCIESGVEKSQFSMLSFFSNTGELICTKQSIITNGVIIPVESNVLKETSRISVLINGKSNFRNTII